MGIDGTGIAFSFFFCLGDGDACGRKRNHGQKRGIETLEFE